MPGGKVVKMCPTHPFSCSEKPPWPVIDEEGEGQKDPGQGEISPEFSC